MYIDIFQKLIHIFVFSITILDIIKKIKIGVNIILCTIYYNILYMRYILVRTLKLQAYISILQYICLYGV